MWLECECTYTRKEEEEEDKRPDACSQAREDEEEDEEEGRRRRRFSVGRVLILNNPPAWPCALATKLACELRTCAAVPSLNPFGTCAISFDTA